MYRIKTGCSLIDFAVIFPMESSEFTRLLNFGSIKKKTAKKPYTIGLKTDFYENKTIFLNLRWSKTFFWNLNRIYSDRPKLDFSDETIRIRNFPFSRNRKLTAENYRNGIPFGA